MHKLPVSTIKTTQYVPVRHILADEVAVTLALPELSLLIAVLDQEFGPNHPIIDSLRRKLSDAVDSLDAKPTAAVTPAPAGDGQLDKLIRMHQADVQRRMQLACHPQFAPSSDPVDHF